MTLDRVGTLVSLLLLPSVLLALVVLIAIAAICARWLTSSGRVTVSFGLTWATLLSAAFVVSVTLMRFSGTSGTSPSGGHEFYPAGVKMWTTQGITRILEDPFSHSDIWLNVLLFVPLGFFCCLFTGRFWVTLAVTTCATVLIEVLQGLFQLGQPDLGDVFTNSLGGLIGALCAVVAAGVLPMAGRPRRPARDVIATFGVSVATAVAVTMMATHLADWQQGLVQAQLAKRFVNASLVSWNQWQSDGPMAMTMNVSDVLPGRRADGQVSVPVPAVRWPATFLGVHRCVIVEFLSADVRITEHSGDDCTKTLAQ